MVEGLPRWSKGGTAFFKHSKALQAGGVWMMRVEEGKCSVGFAGADYEPARNDETVKSTARLDLGTGSTLFRPGISLDGKQHLHYKVLGPHVPESTPFDVALRCDPASSGNVPQVQFNEDGVWHDFVPDRSALKAGPLFPYLGLKDGDRLSCHRVHKATRT